MIATRMLPKVLLLRHPRGPRRAQPPVHRGLGDRWPGSSAVRSRVPRCGGRPATLACTRRPRGYQGDPWIIEGAARAPARPGAPAPCAIIKFESPRRVPCKRLFRTSAACAPSSTTCWCVFDVAGKQRRLAALEEETGRPEFWTDSEAAQRTMRQIAELRAEIAPWVDLHRRVGEHVDLLELAVAEGDEALAAELAASAQTLRHEFSRL